MKHTLSATGVAVTCLCWTLACVTHAEPTIGGGSTDDPAQGPKPAFALGGDTEFVLVKNWDFGTDKGNTIGDIDTMSEHFQYHDQFGWFANGTKYGAYTVAPSEETSLTGKGQPVEGHRTDRPVREFTTDSMKTFIVPLDGADQVHPTYQKAGCGSFQAKWVLERGGSRLGRDMLWQTRLRYETPKYFWFAIWIAGQKWNKGAEIDVIESFGYDNGGEYTNYDGRYWHSSVVGGEHETNYHKSWRAGMEKYGIESYDASEWHVWSLLYRADDTFVVYVDDVVVQRGRTPWTLETKEDGEPLNMSFIFDGGWGHREVKSVNHWLKASELEGKFYEWDYSRVYLGPKVSASNEE